MKQEGEAASRDLAALTCRLHIEPLGGPIINHAYSRSVHSGVPSDQEVSPCTLGHFLSLFLDHGSIPPASLSIDPDILSVDPDTSPDWPQGSHPSEAVLQDLFLSRHWEMLPMHIKGGRLP